MLATERRNIISEMISSRGAVATNDLLNTFDVSFETIRKDMLYLEKKGLLVRVHGGAVSPNRSKPSGDLKKRNLENTGLKQELAFTAAGFIREGDVIALGGGSTCIILANILKDKFKRLTVLTYSVDILSTLSNCSGFSILFCGGTYLPEENSTVGTFALEMIRQVHIQKAFISPMALSMGFGISDYREDITQIQRMLIGNSDEVFILADSSKFEKNSLIKTVDMHPGYKYITDSGLSSEIRSIYGKNKYSVYSPL